MKFDIYKTRDNKYRWRLVASNGQNLGTSPPYDSKEECLSSIEEYRKEGQIPKSVVINYESCFISYSTIDSEFAEHIHKKLTSSGVTTWFAPKDLKYGAKTRYSIDEAISTHDRVIIVLSINSIKSQWVEKEIETALEQERVEDRLVLIPVRIDDSVMSSKFGWAADIRRNRNIGDFSNWKDSHNFNEAFMKLLEAIKK